ncbi:MAG: hypothetical protein WBA12_07520 [Catalinimonas sp.]
MKLLRNLLYAVVALYLVVSLILLLFGERALLSFGVAYDEGFWNFWLTVGMFVLIAEVLIESAQTSALKRRVRKLQQEINEVKARYYDDLAKAGKTPPAPKRGGIGSVFKRTESAPTEPPPPTPYDDVDELPPESRKLPPPRP